MHHPHNNDDLLSHSSAFSIPGLHDELTPIEEEALMRLMDLLGDDLHDLE